MEAALSLPSHSPCGGAGLGGRHPQDVEGAGMLNDGVLSGRASCRWIEPSALCRGAQPVKGLWLIQTQ